MDKENNELEWERFESKLYVVENINFLSKVIVVDAYPARFRKKKRTIADYRSVVLDYKQIEAIIDQIVMRKNEKGEQHEM